MSNATLIDIPLNLFLLSICRARSALGEVRRVSWPWVAVTIQALGLGRPVAVKGRPSVEAPEENRGGLWPAGRPPFETYLFETYLFKDRRQNMFQTVLWNVWPFLIRFFVYYMFRHDTFEIR